MRSFTLISFAAALLVGLTIQLIPTLAADVVFGYLPTWQTDKAEGVDLTKYTHITIAFAIPDENGQITMDNRDGMMKEWMPKISDSHAKVLVSLGGWTGSKYFSPILKDPKKRNRMIDQMTQWMQDHGFDGWDVDYEYPGRQGDSCHTFDAREDTPNFLQFLKDLRHRIDSEFGAGTKLITVATRFQPFDGPQGPMNDVSEFAKYVDYFNPMLYDFNGVWSDTTGPNAPLDYTKGKALQFSFKSSIQSWIDAGIPVSKINAGLPFYGRTVTANSDMANSRDMYQPLSKTIPRGDGDDKEESDISCGGPKLFSGIWKYTNLRSEGVLDAPDSATAPWVRQYDNATNTPWLFNKETKDFVSYDDMASIGAKAEFAAEKGLAGVMIWPITNDYDNELVNAVLTAFSP
ncbi:hypothetical protein GGH94_003102 [Coemansia aciculifera]|uniref:GH18 domain-containing protein n=1 Tax=Coemansia aciculifera TaxID=417176 RepID=A0A9W8IR25_9FUNG|nr:hypothetical protein GGH94_003102 [Coemansia aciculifera]